LFFEHLGDLREYGVWFCKLATFETVTSEIIRRINHVFHLRQLLSFVRVVGAVLLDMPPEDGDGTRQYDTALSWMTLEILKEDRGIPIIL
jgi:hypothetical protein